MSALGRSLVIPMFDEATRIDGTIDALACWPGLAGTEILLVDDGSGDETVALVEARLNDLGPSVRLLRLPHNQGKGAAVRKGMLEATGKLVAFADADLSAGLHEIDRCFEEANETGADVVFASRAAFTSNIAVSQPKLRQLSGMAFNAALKVMGLTTFSDTQCGLKVFRADVARTLFEPLTTNGFAFDVEILLRAQRLGLKLREVPIEWRHFEASRVSPVGDGARMLLDAARLRRTLGASPKAIVAEGMSEATFDVMAVMERRHWWFWAKRRLVARAVLRHLPGIAGVAVDIGCGTGETLRDLHELGFATTAGTDLSRYALRHATRAAAGSPLLTCRAEALPFAAGSLRCLTSLDVVEHLDDDVVALREYARVAAGGIIVCTVPAYTWAWSEHDVNLGHRRRYTRPQLVAAAEAAGLAVLECRYFHHWLVVPAFLIRRTPLRHLVRGQAESASFVHPAVNRALKFWVRIEQSLGAVVDVPFGLSILLVAGARHDATGP